MRLGRLINAWRTTNQIGIREAAKMIGISHATLSRIERGKEPDYKSFIKLFDWLMK